MTVVPVNHAERFAAPPRAGMRSLHADLCEPCHACRSRVVPLLGEAGVQKCRALRRGSAAYRLGNKMEDHGVRRTWRLHPAHRHLTGFTLAPPLSPSWVQDPERLWNAVEARETRRNSQLARECGLGLAGVPDAAGRESIRARSPRIWSIATALQSRWPSICLPGTATSATTTPTFDDHAPDGSGRADGEDPRARR